MKKLRLAIVTLAIIFGMISAFATRSRQSCTMVPNYYWNGTGYSPAGALGQDYYCAQSGDNCTYTIIGGNYVYCQLGTYISLHIKGTKK